MTKEDILLSLAIVITAFIGLIKAAYDFLTSLDDGSDFPPHNDPCEEDEEDWWLEQKKKKKDK